MTEQMEVLETVESKHRSRMSRLLDEIHRWRWWIGGVGLIGLAVWSYFSPDLIVPRAVKIVGLAAVAISIIAFPYSARLVRWLYDPNNPHLVNLDSGGNSIEIWELPPDAWRELTVKEGGELFPLRALFPTWEVRDFDPELGVAEGTWRAGATDLELVVQQGKARSVQGHYERLAREGLGYRVQYSPAVTASVRSVILSAIEAFESEALYRGEEIKKAVEAELDDFLQQRAEERPEEPGNDQTDAEENQRLTLEFSQNGQEVKTADG